MYGSGFLICRFEKPASLLCSESFVVGLVGWLCLLKEPHPCSNYCMLRRPGYFLGQHSCLGVLHHYICYLEGQGAKGVIPCTVSRCCFEGWFIAVRSASGCCFGCDRSGKAVWHWVCKVGVCELVAANYVGCGYGHYCSRGVFRLGGVDGARINLHYGHPR